MALPPSLSENSASSKRSEYKSLALRIAVSLGISLVITQINLEYPESYLYDLMYRTKPFSTAPENIELVYITPETVQTLKGLPNADLQTDIARKLTTAGVKAVVYDFDLSETPGSEDAKNQWEETFKSSAHFYVAGRDTPLRGDEKQLALPEPLEQITFTPAPKTSDLVNFAKDGVTRRMLLTYQRRPMLPLTLASFYNPEVSSISNIRGTFDFYDTDQAYIDFLPANSFPSVSFEKLMEEGFAMDRYKNKIVLIGTDLGQSEDEYILTPFSREVTAMTRIEMQANILNTLIKNSAPIRADHSVGWVLIVFAALLTSHVVLTMKPAQGLLILGATIGGFTLFCAIIFWTTGYWVTMAAPLLTAILCYYIFIPYRLIVENRRSWEYYQKNMLLSQVEELKTNFISMMSHDLKTPIARIQGMTDVILSEKSPLSNQQREAVDTIKHSADDLLKFITSILNYGRIESQGVQLNLKSKDINNLLVDVIRKHEFLAKVKRIQIVTELEPIFPVPVDSDLIRQVLSNLIENAIKYSPEDTKILVSSEEKDGRVVIQVADQGPGIPADELPNIFMKFFRSKNAKSSPIKGSGLGLYLAKYFTELHQGQVFVESSHGKGSTFTVELPIDQRGPHA